MTLLEQQQLFAKLVGQLIDWLYASGYTITFGEAYRTPEQAQWNADHGLGIAHSLHMDRLAIDLNLFRDGQLQETVDEYRAMGLQWKGMHQLARWGGDFKSLPDPSHISLTWGGVE